VNIKEPSDELFSVGSVPPSKSLNPKAGKDIGAMAENSNADQIKTRE